MDGNKTLYPFFTTKKKPHVTVTVTKMHFVGSNRQVYYDKLHNGLTSDFQSGTLIFKKALPWPLMKPQIMTVFYLARLVSVISKEEVQTSGNPLRNRDAGERGHDGGIASVLSNPGNGGEGAFS